MNDYAMRRLLAAFASQGAPDLTGVVSITPAPSARQSQPSTEELRKLSACPEVSLRFIILACAEAGLRSGTAIRVRLCDVIDGRFVAETKKGAITNVPISQDLSALLATLRPDVDTTRPIMELLAGKEWKFPAREMQKRFARWRKACGVRPSLTLHDLRRGLARRIYKATGDVRVVQALLSHRSLASTLWYLDSSNRGVTLAALSAAIDAPPTM